MSNMIPYSDIERMAEAIARSKLFGVKTPEEAIALMVVSQAEGRHPALAARDYHIIEGRPSLKADVMLARFQESGGAVEWLKYTDSVVSARFSHPAGGSLEVEWSMERAGRIKQRSRDGGTKSLTDKDNWRNYPRAMMAARCISEGIRRVYPVVIAGIYTPEEITDADDLPPAAPVDSGSRVERLQATLTARKPATAALPTAAEPPPPEPPPIVIEAIDPRAEALATIKAALVSVFPDRDSWPAKAEMLARAFNAKTWAAVEAFDLGVLKLAAPVFAEWAHCYPDHAAISDPGDAVDSAWEAAVKRVNGTVLTAGVTSAG